MSEDNDSSPELTVITYDIICAFQDRGYSLFSVGLTTSVVPLSPQLLDDIITCRNPLLIGSMVLTANYIYVYRVK